MLSFPMTTSPTSARLREAVAVYLPSRKLCSPDTNTSIATCPPQARMPLIQTISSQASRSLSKISVSNRSSHYKLITQAISKTATLFSSNLAAHVITRLPIITLRTKKMIRTTRRTRKIEKISLPEPKKLHQRKRREAFSK